MGRVDTHRMDLSSMVSKQLAAAACIFDARLR
jgi:hypothetical protein